MLVSYTDSRSVSPGDERAKAGGMPRKWAQLPIPSAIQPRGDDCTVRGRAKRMTRPSADSAFEGVGSILGLTRRSNGFSRRGRRRRYAGSANFESLLTEQFSFAVASRVGDDRGVGGVF
jgi:hypothetical protein